ncbi:MAG: hypothetical protein ABID09_02345 [Candidatus Omnitrophota bacterium]
MSKIIDVLNRRFDQGKDREGAIQEELAKTFFKEPQKRVKAKHALPAKVPWTIAVAAIVLVLFILIFRSNINISVDITGESPFFGQREADSASAALADDTFLIKDGKPNTYFIGNISFLGDAVKFSREKSDMFVLVNSKGDGWANLNIELKEPVNLERLDIAYNAKGQIGDERLLLILIDNKNRSFRMERDLSSELTNDWQQYVINLGPANNKVDMKNISVIRVEFGGLTAGNYSSATIFLKDISVKNKTRGARWP